MPREKTFRFKKFSVLNDKTAMKVGTDGVLLGAWCSVDGDSRVLDVGTGCGLIALMIAQRNAKAIIEGIDIESNAIDEAQLNFSNSPWSSRMSAKLFDFNEFENDRIYDLIVSNPPFFTNGVLPPQQSRNHARHSTTLTLESLIDKSSKLLLPSGVLSFITPADLEYNVRKSAVECSMSVKRMTRVIPVDGNECKRVLWELCLGDAQEQENTLIIENPNREYTEEYKKLTCDFYLKM